MVLLGDAKATAHFSIGSGTKLAMEDAIALARRSVRPAPTSTTALQHYEQRPARGGREDPARRRRVAGLVRACRPLLGFRSRAVRLRRHDPLQGDHLRQSHAARAGLRREVDQAFAQAGPRQGFDVDIDKPVAPMFQPLPLREMKLANRVGGVADVHVLGEGRRARRFPSGALRLARDRRRRPDLHRDDLRRRRDARITPGCTGLWNDEQEAAWRRIVDFVHAQFGGEDSACSSAMPAARARPS